jgi:monothiol glutaredoxin
MTNNGVRNQIEVKIGTNDVVLFMKETPKFPLCGFSTGVADMLSQLGVPVNGLDVLPLRYL